MNKSHILQTFNDQFYDFIVDVQKILPEEKTINLLKNSFLSLKKINPKLIIQVGKDKVVSKYKEQILSGDIDYFLNKDFNEDLNAVDEYKHVVKNGMDKNQINDFIEGLKPKIKTMSQRNQEITIEYLQNLVQLSVLYDSV
jgi:hypothetical protein